MKGTIIRPSTGPMQPCDTWQLPTMYIKHAPWLAYLMTMAQPWTQPWAMAGRPGYSTHASHGCVTWLNGVSGRPYFGSFHCSSPVSCLKLRSITWLGHIHGFNYCLPVTWLYAPTHTHIFKCF